MSRGVLYIATGEKYLSEAKTSAKSVRDNMPDIGIALLTDQDISSELFDIVQCADDLTEDFSSSIIRPSMSPFDRTLFLDTDTYLTAGVTELFDVLGQYDLAVAPAPIKDSAKEVPAPWTQFNTGVIAYCANDAVHELFTRWNDIYEKWRKEHEEVRNQPAFLKAVYESNIDLFTLDPKYNARLFSPGSLYGEAKIVHGRPEVDLETAARQINESSRLRAFFRNSYFSERSAFKIVEDASPRYHLEKSILERGLKKTILDAPRYIKQRVL